MQTINEKFSKSLQIGSIWISLLLHLLLFCIFIISITHDKPAEENSGLYIPSYTYQEPVSASAMSAPTPQKSTMQKSEASSPFGIKKPVLTQSMQQQMLKSAQSIEKTPDKNTEPIHLLGDKKNTPKPLIKLLGKALTASLVYPKMAVDFQLRGTAYVQFLLHPDGQISNIKLVKSSTTSVLDQAAIDAVTAISPLNGVSQFLAEPKWMVFGFVFS